MKVLCYHRRLFFILGNECSIPVCNRDRLLDISPFRVMLVKIRYTVMKKIDVRTLPTQYYRSRYLGAYGTQNKIKKRTRLKLELAIESCTPNFTISQLTNLPLNLAQYNVPSHIGHVVNLVLQALHSTLLEQLSQSCCGNQTRLLWSFAKNFRSTIAVCINSRKVDFTHFCNSLTF